MDLLAILADNRAALLAFCGAALGALLGPLATTWAARQTTKGTLEAARLAAETARQVAELNERSARAVAEIQRDTQRLVERDRAVFDHRRALIEPFLERMRARAQLYGDFFTAVTLNDRDRAHTAARALRDQPEVEYSVALLHKNRAPRQWIEALAKVTAADLDVLHVVSDTMEVLDANQERSPQLMERENSTAAAWGTALDELHVAAEQFIFGAES